MHFPKPIHKNVCDFLPGDRSFFERTPACSSANLHSSGETDVYSAKAKRGDVLFCSERNMLSFLGLRSGDTQLH